MCTAKAKYKKSLLLIFFFALILFSCDPNKNELEYKTGHFPDTPVNFMEINSEFDDYNSDLQVLWGWFILSFSSNRNTEGGTYDFVGKKVMFSWNQINGQFKFEEDTTIYTNLELEILIDSANSTFNEFGPYSLAYRYPDNCYTNLLFYSSDIQGDFDIYYSYSNACTHYNDDPYFFHANKINFIDSSANELYPSFYGEDLYFIDEWGFEPDKISKMVYCSDKNGQYDIYQIDFNSGPDIIATLDTTTKQTAEFLTINSSNDDKCPFVNGKLMVFTSNRPGGYGGYDLYYSQLQDGGWTAPENFGPSINTEFDEYRPITVYHRFFDNSLMIFSSNREGGKGGFDLYYVGIKQMIE